MGGTMSRVLAVACALAGAMVNLMPLIELDVVS